MGEGAGQKSVKSCWHNMWTFPNNKRICSVLCKYVGCNNVKAIAPEQPKLSESESSEESTSSSTTSSPSSDSDDQLSPTVDEYFWLQFKHCVYRIKVAISSFMVVDAPFVYFDCIKPFCKNIYSKVEDWWLIRPVRFQTLKFDENEWFYVTLEKWWMNKIN